MFDWPVRLRLGRGLKCIFRHMLVPAGLQGPMFRVWTKIGQGTSLPSEALAKEEWGAWEAGKLMNG